MDPAARRKMWDVISTSRQGRVIFLTTHLMEEADALSSRIAIMVNGSLECVGTPQHLKTRFGDGYQLQVTTTIINDEVTHALDTLVQDLAPQVKLVERHGGHAKYELPQGLDLAEAFDKLEEKKHEYGIQDYAVVQSTLERVFLKFAQHQADAPSESHQQTEHMLLAEGS